MCFGRWDTPQHALADDPDASDFETSEKIWPGQSTGFIALHAIGLNIALCRKGL